VGSSFNVHQQLSDALFNQLKLIPPDRTSKTASGFYSTAAETLESLKGAHPVVDLVQHRELAKLNNLSGRLANQVIRIPIGHTLYKQTGSVTGRIASQDPNLQKFRSEQNWGGKYDRHSSLTQGTSCFR
jgi:DNA polymerase-1